MIGPQPLQAALAGFDGTLARRVFRQHLAHQENFVAAPGNRFRNQFLGGAVAIHLGGVDQRHAEIEPGAQRLDLVRAARGMFRHLPGALTKDGNCFAAGRGMEGIVAVMLSSAAGIQASAGSVRLDIGRLDDGRPTSRLPPCGRRATLREICCVGSGNLLSQFDISFADIWIRQRCHNRCVDLIDDRLSECPGEPTGRSSWKYKVPAARLRRRSEFPVLLPNGFSP